MGTPSLVLPGESLRSKTRKLSEDVTETKITLIPKVENYLPAHLPIGYRLQLLYTEQMCAGLFLSCMDNAEHCATRNSSF